MSKEMPDYWGIEGQEELSAKSIEELLEDYFDDTEIDLHETIEVIGYDRLNLPDPNDAHCKLSGIVLENTLELLDENFSESRDDCTEPTDKMDEITREYLTKLFTEYIPYDCEEVCRKTVTVKDYYSK